jgi:hypothetical protein
LFSTSLNSKAKVYSKPFLRRQAGDPLESVKGAELKCAKLEKSLL